MMDIFFSPCFSRVRRKREIKGIGGHECGKREMYVIETSERPIEWASSRARGQANRGDSLEHLTLVTDGDYKEPGPQILAVHYQKRVD